jgi:membrane AbrB-like protein
LSAFNLPLLAAQFQMSMGQLLTLAIAAAGGICFVLIGVPGGAMSGAVIAVALLSLTGKAEGITGPLRVTGLCIVGVAIGSVVGPDTFAHMSAYPASIALMTVCVMLMSAISVAVWVFYLKWPLSMAVLSSVPGSMSYIVAVSLSMGTDAARIAVVQMSRVIFLVTLLPFIIVHETGGKLGVAMQVPYPLWILALVVAAGFLGGWAVEKMGAPAGFLIGGLLVSGFIHYMGWAPGRVPSWLMSLGQIIVGGWVGSRFADFDWKLFWRICIGTSMAIGGMMLVSTGCALIANKFLGIPFGAALIGYAPGAQEAMVVLALALGVDPIFVTTHHFARFVLINLALPVIIAKLVRTENPDGVRPVSEHETKRH